MSTFSRKAAWPNELHHAIKREIRMRKQVP